MSKFTSIMSRINGRLATMDMTGKVTGTLGLAETKRMFGDKLANLIENGNPLAIKLAKLIQQRRTHKSCGVLSPIVMENLEKTIGALSKQFGIDDNQDAIDLASMMRLGLSKSSFRSQRHFRDHLTEGAMLNINVMASNCLAIPEGQYMVWNTDKDATVLVPIDTMSNNELVTKEQKQEIVTRDLLNNWNKISRILGEDDDNLHDRSYEHPATGPERKGRPALKKKVEAAGGVRSASEKTGLSPGDISKHINNIEFEVSGQSARQYMDGIGADPDDIFKTGKVSVGDYETSTTSSDDDTDDQNNEKSPRYNRRNEQ